MENISSLLASKVFEKKKFNKKEDLPKRSTIIKEFLEHLNKAREGTKYKPLTPARVAILLSHLDDWDLDIFLAQCKRSSNFSKIFWWSIKAK